MSDCSTEAMKPKEPPCFVPKTCASCGTINCSHLDDYCSNYTLRTDIIEQRNQQLEEVAKEMLGCVFGHRYYEFEHKLMECGVSLDE